METNNNQNKKEYERHTFKSFLTKYRVTIPMVQRDYAQGRTSTDVNRIRNRFLDAIRSYLIQPINNHDVMKMDFVYGEIEKVWSKIDVGKIDEIIVTPLDGQQRLTTLFLLHWYAAKRKVGLQPTEYSFLSHFSYDIRPSSRDFCSRLLAFTPSFDQSLKEQLTDQYWFMGDWHNDPTILGMLTMLDAINDKFADIDNLWDLLTSADDRIIFFFLPLGENGLSDELYIKMNSRGKKLTPFEHFKAEYEALYERDSEESAVINHKFDVEWVDTLFNYRDENNLTDKEFMRYFFYISHILCYRQSVVKSTDEFELIKSLYKESPSALENRRFFENAMDCWYQVKKEFGDIDAFFIKYLSNFTHEKGKVTTYKSIAEYCGCQNFFHACIKLYQVNNNFSYSDFLFLFGIIIYLTNRDKIEEKIFIERLRILRNLIWNSNSGEIRGDSDYMKDLLDEVFWLMLDGDIRTEVKHGFNSFQKKEEQEKLNKKTQMSEAELERMYKFEDHRLIYGYVSGIGYEHLDLTDIFCSVFDDKRDYKDIHLALVSIGDYRQCDNNRYYMANSNRSTWSQLLHRSRNRNNFEQSMSVVINMLERIRAGETIVTIRNSFIAEQEKLRKFTWRYYFAKYPEMLRGADGELDKKSFNDYICITLNKHQFNGQHWNSFLNVIYQRLKENIKVSDIDKTLLLDNYGDGLHLFHPISSVVAVSDGFKYFYQDKEEYWQIVQDTEGIDTEDRVLYAISKIESIVRHYLETQNISDKVEPINIE